MLLTPVTVYLVNIYQVRSRTFSVGHIRIHPSQLILSLTPIRNTLPGNILHPSQTILPVGPVYNPLTIAQLRIARSGIMILRPTARPQRCSLVTHSAIGNYDTHWLYIPRNQDFLYTIAIFKIHFKCLHYLQLHNPEAAKASTLQNQHSNIPSHTPGQADWHHTKLVQNHQLKTQ